jgi:hypothetical protein
MKACHKLALIKYIEFEIGWLYSVTAKMINYLEAK